MLDTFDANDNERLLAAVQELVTKNEELQGIINQHYKEQKNLINTIEIHAVTTAGGYINLTQYNPILRYDSCYLLNYRVKGSINAGADYICIPTGSTNLMYVRIFEPDTTTNTGIKYSEPGRRVEIEVTIIKK